MPIGKFRDFADLMKHVTAGKRIADKGAYAASIARKMNPNFDAEAAAKKRQNKREGK